VEPISVLTPSLAPSQSGNADSSLPILSADNTRVLFSSQAGNLTTNRHHGLLVDVFLRNLTNGTTTLVSVTPDGGSGGNGSSFPGGISTNNQFVLFQSRAGNLVANDTNNASDVFVRDLINETTTLVSLNRFGTGSGNGNSSGAALTPDGRFVAFESTAPDLVPNDTNLVSDVFLRDLQAGTTTLISVRSNGVYSAAGASGRPAISANGNVIAFVSQARNLARGNNNTTNELYLRDLAAGTTRMIDISRPGAFPGAVNRTVEIFTHALSDDGLRLAFLARSSNTNAVPDGVYFADLQNNTNYLVATNLYTGNTSGRPTFQGPVMSADGRMVAFEGRPRDSSSTGGVYAWDSLTGVAELISTNEINVGGLPGTFGLAPALSADGNKVAYLGYSTNDPPVPNNSRLQLFVRDRVAGTTSLVTVDPAGNPGSDAEFPSVSLGSDGRLIAFQSRDDQLVEGDRNLAGDVFVRDLEADTTTLVSQRAAPLPSLTGLGASVVAAGGLSADGRYVVFVSDADDLAAGDTNGLADVFVHDLTAGTNLLISINAAADGSGDGVSRDAVLSADGHSVAFVSGASNLVNNDTNALDDVFVHDLQTRTTVLASINFDHSGSANGSSAKPSISADGRWTSFQSRATDLVPGDGNSVPDVFVYDRTTGSNTVVSVSFTTGLPATGASEVSLMTPGGRHVIFQSRAGDQLETSPGSAATRIYARDLTNNVTLHVSRGANAVFTSVPSGTTGIARDKTVSLDGNWVAFEIGPDSGLYVCDLRADANTPSRLVSTNAGSPSLSADGRFVAYELQDPAAGVAQIMVTDLIAGTTVLASGNGTGTGGGNGNSATPMISGDGRFVVFKSRADDLVGNDTNTWSDIFVRDLRAGITYLASAGQDGPGGGDQLSANPQLGPDGRTVVFQSFASNLGTGDRNNRRDVFVIRLGVGDSEGDGLPDDWEVTYFNNLDRDGTGDFDNDGQSDRAEYLAGTNPTDNGSILQVLSITVLGTGEKTVIWSAVPGKSYRLQLKDDLSGVWNDSPTVTVANSSQGAAVDSSGSVNPNRFYRVVALP